MTSNITLVSCIISPTLALPVLWLRPFEWQNAQVIISYYIFFKFSSCIYQCMSDLWIIIFALCEKKRSTRAAAFKWLKSLIIIYHTVLIVKAIWIKGSPNKVFSTKKKITYYWGFMLILTYYFLCGIKSKGTI